MKAGTLRERITIERLNRRENEVGEIEQASATNWTAVCTRWAAVVMTAANEIEQAKQPRQEIRYTVTMRYTAELTTDRRIKWGEHTLAIAGIVSDPKRRQMVATCIERP